jgi:hypothetical protein
LPCASKDATASPFVMVRCSSVDGGHSLILV